MIKLAAAFLSCALGVLPLCGQGPALARIETEGKGLFFFSVSDLARLVDVRTLDPSRLGVFQGDHQVPSRIRGALDGRLDPVDGIVFYSPGPLSHFSKSATFVLRHAREPLRILQDGRRAPDDAPGFGPVRLELEQDRMHVAVATVRQDVIRGAGSLSQWYWHRLLAPGSTEKALLGEATTATIRLPVHPEPRPGSPASLRMDVLGAVIDGVQQRLAVDVNGRPIGEVEWTKGLEQSLAIDVPPDILRRDNIIRLRNVSPAATYDEPGNELGRSRRNVVFLDRVVITFESLLAGPSQDDDQISYLLPPAGKRGARAVKFGSLSPSGFRLYDVKRRSFVASRTATLSMDKETLVICVGATGLKRIKLLAPARSTAVHLSGQGADYVVVTTSRLRPFLSRLVDHRAATGLTPLVVEARQLYDTFTHGRFSPEAITEFLRQASRNWKLKPRYLLLVGDADRDVDWISKHETIPAAMVMTDYNGPTASDTPYGDLDGDGLAEISVGRLPVRQKDHLVDIIERIISLEQNPEPGPWRRKLSFVAGEARFGTTIDRLLENTLRSVLRKDIPQEFRVSLTYASPGSPYFWPAPGFAGEVVRQFNEGSLAFTYVGHGSTRAFDAIRVGRARFPIMDARHVQQVDAGNRNPVLTIIACWTGEYDRPEKDCIGELLLRKNGGPAAVIASSRVSHPFPDALLGRALASRFFGGNRRLGDVLREAKASMMKQGRGGPALLVAKPFLSSAIAADTLVKDHLYLYNLLGDPAMLLPLPKHEIGLELPKSAPRGKVLIVKGSVPGAVSGLIILSLDRRTGDLPWKKTPKAPAGDPNALELIKKRHRAANDPVVASSKLQLEGATFKTGLHVPADIEPGPYVVRCYFASASGDGVTAQAIVIE